MLRKILAVFLALIVAAGCIPAAFGQNKSKTDSALQWVMRQQNAEDLQALANSFADSPGNGEEWLVLALCRSSETVDFSVYRAALVQALPNMEDPADRLRAALALSAMGGDEDVTAAIEAAIGQRGIMSWIFGLLALDSRGYESPLRAEAVQKLLSLQKEDGGWALAGDYGDTDVTAMALQALAPYCHHHAVGVAVKNGLGRLSEMQKDNGGFANFGTENAESSAQVLITLQALGMEADDPLFVKNGPSPLDALLDYRQEDGGFSHIPGAPADSMATTQALLALCALELDTPLYIFEKTEHTGALPEDFSPAAKPDEPQPTAAPGDPPLDENEATVLSVFGRRPIKFWILLGAALLWAGCTGVSLLRRHGKKKALTVLLGGAVLMAVLWLVPIQTPAEYAAAQLTGDTPVTVTIDCSRAVEHKGKNGLPKDGLLLPETTLYMAEDATVLDALRAAAAQNGFTVETTGLPGNLYVRGIAGLYEFDAGELSGWIFLLNGERISQSCSVVPIAANDRIEWVYTLALGNDIS